MKKMFIVFIIFMFGLIVLGCDTGGGGSGKVVIEKYFRVLYVGNENTSGETPVDNNNYTSGTEVIVLDKGTLIKDGYIFKHWNTNIDDSGTSYSAGDIIIISNHYIYLYAIWEIVIF